ncbi:hypothetical protein GCM10007235_12020 [Pseudoxanthomonas indica]|nr:hypothetical protein GCM10007235_12020 [Pseudoxanthomonas indica]
MANGAIERRMAVLWRIIAAERASRVPKLNVRFPPCMGTMRADAAFGPLPLRRQVALLAPSPVYGGGSSPRVPDY